MNWLKNLSPAVYLALIGGVVSITLGVTALSAATESSTDSQQTEDIAKASQQSVLATQQAIFDNCITGNGLRRKVFNYFQAQIDEINHPSPITRSLIKSFHIPKHLINQANKENIVQLRAVRDKFQPVPCKQKYSDFDKSVIDGGK